MHGQIAAVDDNVVQDWLPKLSIKKNENVNIEPVLIFAEKLKGFKTIRNFLSSSDPKLK